MESIQHQFSVHSVSIGDRSEVPLNLLEFILFGFILKKELHDISARTCDCHTCGSAMIATINDVYSKHLNNHTGGTRY